MIVRPATKEDIEAYSDLHDKPTIKAWVGEVDGEVVGISGLALHQGRWFIFCDLKDEAKKYPITIARNAHRVMDEVRKMGIKFVYAQIDLGEPRSIAWLGTLGFEPDPRVKYLYRWRK